MSYHYEMSNREEKKNTIFKAKFNQYDAGWVANVWLTFISNGQCEKSPTILR